MTCHHAPITGHQPIPEDEAHCPCITVGSFALVGSSDTCPCPCHGPNGAKGGRVDVHAPAWSDDASVPDLIEDPLD